MSNIAKVRMTLTGALAGKTCTLNKCRFVSGVCEDILHIQNIDGLRRYFTRTYSVKFEVNPRDEMVVDVDENEEPILPEMDERQLAVLRALYRIAPEHWDRDLPIPRPPVSLVAEHANDPHLTMEELVTVCETWLGKVDPSEFEVEETEDEVEEVEETEDEVEESAEQEAVEEAPEVVEEAPADEPHAEEHD